MDASADATQTATVGADIGASSFGTFPGDPFLSLASPDSSKIQDLFASPLPELANSSHANRTFSQPLPIAEQSSSNGSTLFADTSTLGSTSRQPSLGSQQEIPVANATIDLEFKQPDNRALTAETDSRNLLTKHSDRTSCEVCQKQFSRKHELR